jgi:hypothetical protein
MWVVLLLLLAVQARGEGISPETILPMHERRAKASMQTANATDPSLDISISAHSRYEVGMQNVIIKPYWHKTMDAFGGEVRFPLGYELESRMQYMPSQNKPPPIGTVLVEVDGVPMADFDFFEDILADPKEALGTSSARMVPIVGKQSKHAEAFNTIGFLKVEFIDLPRNYTFRPIGDLRYEMSMQAMADYAEDQVRQLAELKEEMERKSKEESALREKLLKEAEAEVERKVREQLLKEEKERGIAMDAKRRMEEAKMQREEDERRAAEAGKRAEENASEAAKKAKESAAEAAKKAKESATEAAERKKREERQVAQRVKEEEQMEREEVRSGG